MTTNEDTQKLLTHITTQFGTDPNRWFRPDGYQSVALAILDSIYSTSNRYAGVINLVNRYRHLRTAEGADPEVDTATDLIETFHRWGGVDTFVERTNNRWRTSSQFHAPYKAYAALEAAKVLAWHSIETVNDAVMRLESRESRERSDISKEWLAITGQKSALTWNYFLMLNGIPGVKADRMVVRFVTQSLGRQRKISPKDASRLVEEVADIIGANYSYLDHTIWRYQSDRPYLQPDKTRLE
ncbi:heme peroxidase [Corynebacterium sp. A21]|uniref:heme peroxidase n=1 Tax=Corynebacterium sp. A21 TaxID=3457318 RepID=UPI003FD3685F